MTRLTLLAAALLALGATAPAWSSPVTLAPAPAEGQEIKVEQGVSTLISTREGSEVWVTPGGQRADKRLTLTIGVANDGSASADIDGRNVEVYTIEGAKLAVYDLAALEKEAKSKTAMAGFAAALAGGLANNTSAYGYNRSATAARGVAFSFANVMSASADASAAEVQSEASANLLQPMSVDPGQTGGGQILIQKPPKGATALRVRVTFAGELHELRFDLRE
jgi:hypothetical protein